MCVSLRFVGFKLFLAMLAPVCAWADGATVPTVSNSYVASSLRNFTIKNYGDVANGDTKVAQLSLSAGRPGDVFIVYGETNGYDRVDTWQEIRHCRSVSAEAVEFEVEMPEGYGETYRYFGFIFSAAITGDVDSYICADKLMLHLDGFLNMGKDQASDANSTKWVDLVEGREFTTVSGDNTQTMPVYTGKGYRFTGNKCGIESEYAELAQRLCRIDKAGVTTVELSLVPSDEVVQDGTIFAMGVRSDHRFFELRPNKAPNAKYFDELVWKQSGSGNVDRNIPNATFGVRNNVMIRRRIRGVNVQGQGVGNENYGLDIYADLGDHELGYERATKSQGVDNWVYDEAIDNVLSLGCPSVWSAKCGQKFLLYSMRVYAADLTLEDGQINRRVDQLRFEENPPTDTKYAVAFGARQMQGSSGWAFDSTAMVMTNDDWSISVSYVDEAKHELGVRRLLTGTGWDGTDKELDLSSVIVGANGNYYTVVELAEGCFSSAFTTTRAVNDGRVKIKLPTGVRTIGIDAFNGCNAMIADELKLESLELIYARAFKGTSGLTCPVVFGGKKFVTFGGSDVFNGSTGIPSFTFGSGVTNICDRFCPNNPKLTTLKFPKALQRIGINAFQNASALTGEIVFGPDLNELCVGCFAVADPGGDA